MTRAGAVTAVLRDAGVLTGGEAVDDVVQLAGGWSRHSFVARASDRRWVVRAQPPGALLDTDLDLEYRIFDALAATDVPAPRVHALEPRADTPFGGPYFVMEHVAGAAPDMYSRADRDALAADWDGPRAIAGDMVDTLARIHALPSEALPRDLPAYDFDAVVARWRAAYDERRLVRDPILEEAYAWVAPRAPAEPWPGLVHGDFRIGNTLVHDGRVRAVLDWELAYRGDVRFDLGYLAMARAAGKHLHQRSPLMGCFADEGWFLAQYAQRTGRAIDPDDLRTFQMLGIMMLLSTQLTAVWMYANRRTTDVRMAWSRWSFAGLRQDMTRLMAW
jgi:aminoglycoside phosphotransferase (APT) family kinase protein